MSCTRRQRLCPFNLHYEPCTVHIAEDLTGSGFSSDSLSFQCTKACKQSGNVQKKQQNLFTNKSESIHSDNILIQQSHGTQTKVSTFNVNWIFLGPKAINLWQWINTYTVLCSILMHARETKTHSFSLSVAREQFVRIYVRAVFDSSKKISEHRSGSMGMRRNTSHTFHFKFKFCANERKIKVTKRSIKYVETYLNTMNILGTRNGYTITSILICTSNICFRSGKTFRIS